MSPAAQKKTDEYQALLVALQDALGVVVGDERHGQILARLSPVMQAYGLTSIEALAARIQDETAGEIRASVLQAITAHDSIWFGYPEISKLLTGYVLPGVINQNRADYRIWLVGCGSGQIAYSLAMTVDTFKRQNSLSCEVEIVATDLSEALVQQAATGRYEASMLQGLPEQHRQKYMVRRGNEWEIEKPIRSMLHFKPCNLLEDIPDMGHFDLVVCPDMLIYFSNGVKHRILDEFADVLDPSGVLITSANESVVQFSKRFELVNHEAGSFNRQLPDA